MNNDIVNGIDMLRLVFYRVTFHVFPCMDRLKSKCPSMNGHFEYKPLINKI
jgi:hypothetical protein